MVLALLCDVLLHAQWDVPICSRPECAVPTGHKRCPGCAEEKLSKAHGHVLLEALKAAQVALVTALSYLVFRIRDTEPAEF